MGQQGGLRHTGPVVVQLPVFTEGTGEEAESGSRPQKAGGSAFHEEARVQEYTVTWRGSSPVLEGRSQHDLGLKLSHRWANAGAVYTRPCLKGPVQTHIFVLLAGQLSVALRSEVKKGKVETSMAFSILISLPSLVFLISVLQT